MTKGLNAIVTGSTSGIGLGIAEAFAGAGMNVMLNGFGDEAAIEALRARLADAYGVTVGFHGADMTKPDEIAALVDHARESFGQVDVVVNNAGIQHVSPVDEFPIEKWDAILAINLSSAFHTTRLALPGMRDRGFGRIVGVVGIRRRPTAEILGVDLSEPDLCHRPDRRLDLRFHRRRDGMVEAGGRPGPHHFEGGKVGRGLEVGHAEPACARQQQA